MPKRIEDCVILYVEDDDATAHLFDIALREADIRSRLLRAVDGEDAIKLLSGAAVHEHAPNPDVVLLDLNLPKRSGFEVLGHIRNHPRLLEIPVYVFTSSETPNDRATAIAAGATGYLIKGSSFESFVETAKMVCASLTDYETNSKSAANSA